MIVCRRMGCVEQMCSAVGAHWRCCEVKGEFAQSDDLTTSQGLLMTYMNIAGEKTRWFSVNLHLQVDCSVSQTVPAAP